ncbi:hypothetical protein [Curtobacterium aurantiacum]|uniref:Uncharacterized protein n=1 Tax=Curtobacterium aurantiacum TaxID=3236919 RepID=A0ABS5VEJ8_9MICO|nr:hypothetical protein [Curtobacterium flaccumfaciens]MBT1587921.1 hypothetical protein [Curtobacterium flaccumfaciens pv. flaccumfaciens]
MPALLIIAIIVGLVLLFSGIFVGALKFLLCQVRPDRTHLTEREARCQLAPRLPSFRPVATAASVSRPATRHVAAAA